MGVDGFNQAQYLQLALDVRCGNPPPRPSLVIRLPLPPRKYLRKRGMINRDSETDDEETEADEVLGFHPLSRVTRFRQNNTERRQQDSSPTAQRQRRRSKRRHRSGPGGEDYGVPGKLHHSLSPCKRELVDITSNNQLGYPVLLSADRSAPAAQSQLPSLPSTFTMPARPPTQRLGPVREWLDPQLLGQSSMEPTTDAQSDHLATRTVPGLTATRDTANDSGYEDHVEEEIGAWSM